MCIRDSNVEAQRFGEPVVPDFPIPYHTEIMESFDGIDMDAAGRVEMCIRDRFRALNTLRSCARPTPSSMTA